MAGPAWLSWVLAGLMTGSALYHGARLAEVARPGAVTTYDVDLTHLVMSGAMVVMLLLPLRPAGAAACTGVFLLPVLWFAGGTLRAARHRGWRASSGPGRQLVMCTGMLVMAGAAAAVPAASAGARMPVMDMTPPSTGPVPVAALTVLVALGVVAAMHARELSHVVVGRPGPVPPPRAPAAGLARQLAMTAVMTYMLVPLAV